MRLSPDGRVAEFATDSRLQRPHHLVLMRDGSLLTAADDNGLILRVAPDGVVSEFFNSHRVRSPEWRTFSAGRWGDPFTVDEGGNIYALAEPGGSAIVRIAPDGSVVPLPRGDGTGGLHFAGMASGPDGALYVTDQQRVWRITSDGATPVVTAGLTRAVGIALDSAGAIFVADHGAGRVTRFTAEGSPTAFAGLDRTRFRGATGVAIANGAVYALTVTAYGTEIWRITIGGAERLQVVREPASYARWLLVALPVLLIALLVERAVKRKRAGSPRPTPPPAPRTS